MKKEHEEIIDKRAKELSCKGEYFPLREKTVKKLLIEGWDLLDSVIDTEEKHRIKKIDDEKKRLIEEMEGCMIRATYHWLKDNDPYLSDKIYNSDWFVRGLNYKPAKESIIAELLFTETGIRIKATHKDYHSLSKEDYWFTDSYEDWGIDRLQTYKKKINQ